MRGIGSTMLPASLLALLVAGCALEPAVEGEETSLEVDQPAGEEGVARLTAAAYCVPKWTLIRPAQTACYVDRDRHLLYYTLEVHGVDLYRDMNGCFPDAYKRRRLDKIRCTYSISVDSCLGRWSQEPLVRTSFLMESDRCPRPRVEDFPAYTGEPPPRPVCQTVGTINIGMSCNESWCNEAFGRACSAAGGQTGYEPGGWLVCKKVVCN